MSYTNIDFSEYSGMPQEICEILRACANPISLKKLKEKFNYIADIEQLIKNKIIINENNLCVDCNYNANTKFKQLKQYIDKVYPILHFKFYIEKLDISYKKYSDFISSIPFSDKLIIQENRKESELIYHIENIVSTIYQLHQILAEKIKFIAAKNDYTLTEKYNNDNRQKHYNNLLNSTIKRSDVYGFNDLIRHILAHGDNTMWFVNFFNSINNKFPIVCCDYFCIETAKINNAPHLKNAKENLYYYYSDTTTEAIKFCIEHNIGMHIFNDDILQYVKSDIAIKTNVKNPNLSFSELQKIITNKDLVLFMYNLWKKRKSLMAGQFHFNIHRLLKNLYNYHIEYYRQIYYWVTYENNKDIKDYSFSFDELTKLNPEHIMLGEKFDFKLHL